MATVTADGGAGGNGHRLSWFINYNTVTDVVKLTVAHLRFDDSAASGPPLVARLNIVLVNGTTRTFNLLTLVASTDGQPGVINKGEQTYNGVSVRVSNSRGNLIEFSTDYTPPAD